MDVKGDDSFKTLIHISELMDKHKPTIYELKTEKKTNENTDCSITAYNT